MRFQMEKRAPPGEANITELLPKNGLVYSEKTNLSEVGARGEQMQR